ncbi:dienelactone hydrolase family protein [Nonomuraea maritima]|uniref:dienelactone hydrolase family protein n=1 Tax=Nonomuraea maritima TaxID=683260 RepID=UPI000B830327|nr:dienelactone hydrolase family protein [Nonomuraea maritima]
MCHSTDSRPPAPPVQGKVASHEQIELTAADGNRFLAYRAVPEQPNGRAMVILPDIRGLHPYYRDLAVRFAEAGFHAIAIDYFGRSAGIGDRSDDFAFMPHVEQLTTDHVRADARAATEALAEVGPVFIVGFCLGGAHAVRQASESGGNGLAGGIGFYPTLRFVDDPSSGPGAPVLMLRGGADTATTPERFAAFEAKLDEYGTAHEAVVFEGAPHSFFDRSYGEWAETCQAAWQKILDFTERPA